MAPKYNNFQLLDGFARAAFIRRQEAASILHAQLLLCQLETHQEDPLSGCYVASHCISSSLKLWQVTRSSSKTTAAGLLDVEETLLHCTDGCSDDEQQLSLSALVDLLPPAVGGEGGAAEHISEASWGNAVQQLHASAEGRSLSTNQQVATVMLKLWRYSTAHRLLQPVQQVLKRHRSSMAVLRPTFTALQDFSNGRQLHAKLQQQLQPQQQQPQQQQQQQCSWAQLLAEPSDALVQQLHNQLPGVPPKGLLQLLQRLSEVVAGLDAHLTPDMLQQMLHELDNPGSFQPVEQQLDKGKQQQQKTQGNATLGSVQVKQEQQHPEPQTGITTEVVAAAAEPAKQEQQEQQQDGNEFQLNGAAPGQAVLLPPHTELHTQQQGAEALQGHVQRQQQLHQHQQQAASAQVRTVLPSISVLGTQAAYSQQVEDEPYSPTRHAAEEAATAAAPTLATAAAVASVAAEAGAANTQQRQGQQQQQQQQLVGAQRAAGDSEQLQQPHSKKAATLQPVAAAVSSKSDANGTAAWASAADGNASASAAAGLDDASAAPAAATPAAGEGSTYKLPGEAYALTLFDDLRFSLQQLGSAKAVVDTRGGRLVQLSWYLQVNEPLRQRLPSQELALKFLAKFPGVFRLEKRPSAIGSTPETFLGLQADAAQALLAGKRCQQLLAAYKARLHSHLQQQQQQGSSVGGVLDVAVASNPRQAGGLLDHQLQQYSDKLFPNFQAFAEAALADEFVPVNTGHGRQGLVAEQSARAEPADSSSLSLETGELSPDGGAAAVAEASNVMPLPGASQELSVQLPPPPPAANGVLPWKWSGRAPAAAACAADADMAWLGSAVANVLHPQDEQQQQQEAGGALSRDRSSVWERLGGAFGHPGHVQDDAGSPKAPAEAAATRLPSPALAGRLQLEVQLPLQRNRSKEPSPSPALASRLQQPSQPDKQPSSKKQQQLPSVPQLAPETMDLLDLAIVDAFVEHAFAERGTVRLPEARGAKQELRQEDAEMPLEALIAALLARKHQLPGVETEGQLLRWLYHLQIDRGMLLPESPEPSAAAGPAAAGAAAGGRKAMRLPLRLMLQRLLAHRQLQMGQQLAQRAEEVLIAELRREANRPGRLHVPRMPLQKAGRLLQEEVPALQPYLLVPGFLEGWVKRELHHSFVLTTSLEQQLPHSRRLPIREVNLEVTLAAADARGLELRCCWRYRETATCLFGDRCFASHSSQRTDVHKCA